MKTNGADSNNVEGRQGATQTRPPPLDPCAIAAAGLARFRAAATAVGGVKNVEQPVVVGERVEDTTVFRAIAAVTEATSGSGGGVQFSTIELTILQDALAGDGPNGRNMANDAIRKILARTGWEQSDRNSVRPVLPALENATRQRGQWERGIHVVLSV